ncbi:kinase-like protein [Delitschia confertaspora ATCC 74209]|uniref:Kinase-like protein n=1 Tax=Delitschia confertaspora ATCC 74209 TaxID=1513339 RepID=A0A9P4MMC8_9PLEO|nr:kinase-like protein [Delitschia confertaspora ATCC 74209]
MAPVTPSSHTFQKLKLDTSTSPKPVTSTFGSIPRREPQRESSLYSLLHSAAALTDSGVPHRENGNDTLQVDDDGERRAFDGLAASIGTKDAEAKFKLRQTSISFDPKVTLDCGNRLSAERPLPKSSVPDTLPERSYVTEPNGRPIISARSEERKCIEHPILGPGYSLRSSAAGRPLTPSSFADRDHAASLTSAATASSPLEEAQTPLDSVGYALSPLQATSPVGLPFSSRRSGGSVRSRNNTLAESEGGTRRTSRRSSTMSGRSLSSMSPAASFLSQYRASGRALKPTEPDDEGQGIGYHGEYIIGKQIGFGGFSVVKEVTTIEDGARIVHAVKIVRKQLKEKSEIENEQIQSQFDHEVEIWRFLRHPYILPLLRVYNTEFATYCITRLNKGGTLHDLVRDTRKKQRKGLPLSLAKRYTYQLASAIRYLHNDVMVVHRDIKLENCLVDMSIPNADVEGGDVLLCDFGMADFIISDQRDGPEPHSTGDNQNIGPADTSTSAGQPGSLQYAAPELFNAPGPIFSPAADIWAFGVCVYALLTAQFPFNEGLDSKTLSRINKGDWDVELVRGSEALQDGDEAAIHLLKGCLDLNPDKRWDISQILDCKWLEGCKEQYDDVARPWMADS